MASTIRASGAGDDDAIWRILEPTFRAGETYPIPRDVSRADALAYWRSPGPSVFVAEENGAIAGTYYLRANNRGSGDHVASRKRPSAVWYAGGRPANCPKATL